MRSLIPWFLVAGGAALVAVAAGPAKSVEDERRPESVLPSDAVAIVRFDGSAAHRPALEETAAWKAFEATGLRERIFDVVETLIAAEEPAMAQTVRDAAETFLSEGMTATVSLRPQGVGATPMPVMLAVFHGQGNKLGMLSGLMAGQAERRGQASDTVTIDGLGLQVYGEKAEQILLGEFSDHLLVGFGSDPAGLLRSVLEADESACVTAHPAWNRLREADGKVTTGFAWVSVDDAVQPFAQVPVGPNQEASVTVGRMRELLGLDTLAGGSTQGWIEGEVTWSMSSLNLSGEPSGLLTFLDGPAMTMADLPPLPTDVNGFLAVSVDWDEVWSSGVAVIRDFLSEVSPRERASFEEDYAQFTAMIGGDPSRTLLKGMGNVVCIYNDPISMPFPGGISPVLAVSVEDRDLLMNSLSRLKDLVRNSPLSREMELRESWKDGDLYITVSLREIPIAPTLLISDQWVAFSLMPGAVQMLKQRMDGKLTVWTPGDELQETLNGFPDEFLCMQFTDPAPQWQQLMTFAPMGINLLENQVLAGMNRNSPNRPRLPFGIADLPTPGAVTEPMFPNLAVTYRTPEGLQELARRSVPQTPIGDVASAGSAPILVALLLPAVQQAREAARRTASKNNLKQIMLAMHNYHDVYNHFPRGTAEGPEELKPEERLSWAYSILPFIEQMALYETIDKDSGWASNTNSQARSTAVPVYQNPSMPRPVDSPSSIDYVGIAGVGEDAATLPVGHPRAGMFGYDRKVRIRDILDGTSNTVAVMDRAIPAKSYLGGGGMTIQGFSKKPYLNGPDGIGSPHAGVVQAAFADGSVREISVNIDEELLEKMATIAGGEVLSEF